MNRSRAEAPAPGRAELWRTRTGYEYRCTRAVRIGLDKAISCWALPMASGASSMAKSKKWIG